MSDVFDNIKKSLFQKNYRELSLQLVNPRESLFEKTKVSYALEEGHLLVHFLVPSPVLFAKETFSEQEFPYEFDVTEVFITCDDISRQNFSYYEFEVTPYGQIYHLQIDFKNGERQPGKILNTKTLTGVCVQDRQWETCFMIPLREFDMQRQRHQLQGNFFTILDKDPRTYWSAFLPQQETANFHKPEFFKPLFS